MNKMNRREFMGTTVAAGLALQQARQLPTRPNVIFILADDMGYGDLPSYGGTDLRTPNIDRLVREGVRLTDFYANGATCTPTRAGLITGRYQSMPKLPFTPGVDAAGTVRAVGTGVARVKPGDRVLIHVDTGAYATEALAREDQCLQLPDEMSFVEATALGLAAQTAWFALLERGIDPGLIVLSPGESWETRITISARRL